MLLCREISVRFQSVDRLPKFTRFVASDQSHQVALDHRPVLLHQRHRRVPALLYAHIRARVALLELHHQLRQPRLAGADLTQDLLDRVRHLRPLMVVPSMSTAKNAVARTFSCDIAVNTAASMRSSAG